MPRTKDPNRPKVGPYKPEGDVLQKRTAYTIVVGSDPKQYATYTQVGVQKGKELTQEIVSKLVGGNHRILSLALQAFNAESRNAVAQQGNIDESAVKAIMKARRCTREEAIKRLGK